MASQQYPIRYTKKAEESVVMTTHFVSGFLLTIPSTLHLPLPASGSQTTSNLRIGAKPYVPKGTCDKSIPRIAFRSKGEPRRTKLPISNRLPFQASVRSRIAARSPKITEKEVWKRAVNTNLMQLIYGADLSRSLLLITPARAALFAADPRFASAAKKDEIRALIAQINAVENRAQLHEIYLAFIAICRDLDLSNIEIRRKAVNMENLWSALPASPHQEPWKLLDDLRCNLRDSSSPKKVEEERATESVVDGVIEFLGL
jgi:hypothetical protein